MGLLSLSHKKKRWHYDQDLVLVLSDWTNENPHEVLRTLKRGSEWYAIKKGSDQSFLTVLKGGALKAQLALWKSRMPGMDISDVYYDTFLVNGKKQQHYPNLKGGGEIRVRVINAAASSYFWLVFGTRAVLISADGVDVQPLSVGKVLNAVAQTYDFLITLPKNRAVEFKAYAQDGSGSASAILGTGKVIKAPLVPPPDLIAQMKHHARGHGAGHSNHHIEGAENKKATHPAHHHPQTPAKKHHSHGARHHHPPAGGNTLSRSKSGKQNHHQTQAGGGSTPSPSVAHHQEHSHHKNIVGATLVAPTPREAGIQPLKTGDLKALQKTSFPARTPVRHLTFNLTGNMRRYVWNINGKALSRSDKIKIHKGEVLRITLNNTTMMHHPMHLHGHFFRVLNSQGEYSPLRHTVDVPPHQKITVEFMADETGHWFFHCHILYHMKQGMSRVFTYYNDEARERNPQMADYPVSSMWNNDNHWFRWGGVSLMSNYLAAQATAANTLNQWDMEWETLFREGLSPRHQHEGEISYQRFITDHFRLRAGAGFHKREHRSLFQKPDDGGLASPRGGLKNFALKAMPEVYVGFQYLLPYLIDSQVSVNQQGHLNVELDYELHLLLKWEGFAEGEWTLNIPQALRGEGPHSLNHNQDASFFVHTEWTMGIRHIIHKNIHWMIHYHNHFGWGAGLHALF